MDGQILIYGNESARMADLLGKEIRRPMTRGVLNASEQQSLAQIAEIVKTTLPEGSKGSKVCFSIPAPRWARRRT
jgi:hypothetical protein